MADPGIDRRVGGGGGFASDFLQEFIHTTAGTTSLLYALGVWRYACHVFMVSVQEFIILYSKKLKFAISYTHIIHDNKEILIFKTL